MSRAAHCLTTPAPVTARPGVRIDPRMSVADIVHAARAAGFTVTETCTDGRRLALDITTDPGGPYQFRAYFRLNPATGFWRWDRSYYGTSERIFSMASLTARLTAAARQRAPV